MFVFRLLLKNAFRHKLRTGLTVLGLVVAICAYGLLRTIVDGWYAGAEASSSTRLITRSATSLTVPLTDGVRVLPMGVGSVPVTRGASGAMSSWR